MDNQRMRLIRKLGKSGNKCLELVERERSNLVARVAMQSKLNRAIHDLPRKRLPLEVVHTVVAWFFEAWLFDASYMVSISLRNRSAIKSRFSLPFAVSRPLSMVNASSTR